MKSLYEPPFFICVDFDGCLVEAEYPNIGAPKQEVIDFVKELVGRGWKTILWTCRSGDELQEAVDHAKMLGIDFDFVNENPMSSLQSRKIFAHIYLDDMVINAQNVTEYSNYIYEQSDYTGSSTDVSCRLITKVMNAEVE